MEFRKRVEVGIFQKKKKNAVAERDFTGILDYIAFLENHLSWQSGGAKLHSYSLVSVGISASLNRMTVLTVNSSVSG